MGSNEFEIRMTGEIIEHVSNYNRQNLDHNEQKKNRKGVKISNFQKSCCS